MPVTVPPFTRDTGIQLVDPVTKSSLNKQARLCQLVCSVNPDGTACDGRTYLSMKGAININVRSTTCIITPVASLAISARIYEPDADRAAMDALFARVIRDWIYDCPPAATP